MITPLAPCPVCGRTPKHYQFKTGWVVSCVGDRHYASVDDQGNHQIQLYRGTDPEEPARAWNKAMGPKQETS